MKRIRRSSPCGRTRRRPRPVPRQEPVQAVLHGALLPSPEDAAETLSNSNQVRHPPEFRHFQDAARAIFIPASPLRVTANLPEPPRPARQPIIIMSYRYEFDDTRDGDLRLRRPSYEILQDAYRRLRDELQAWNRRALDHGASSPPYEQEVDDLNRMLAWGNEQLAHAGATGITIRGISVASSRYAKVALTLAIHRRLARLPQLARDFGEFRHNRDHKYLFSLQPHSISLCSADLAY